MSERESAREIRMIIDIVDAACRSDGQEGRRRGLRQEVCRSPPLLMMNRIVGWRNGPCF